MAKSNDIDLKDLLCNVGLGKLQLPEFQRSWVWDDMRICKLLESLISGYPMGAVLELEYGGNDIHFKYRVFTGVDERYCGETPNGLILDGQQRLTTLYQSLYCKSPVLTCLSTNRDTPIKRYYYVDMSKIVQDDADVLECIRSVPEDKKVKTNIGRDIELDLSTPENEYAECYYPINLIFDPIKSNEWMMGYQMYHHYDTNYIKLYNDFMMKVLQPVQSYKLPVIRLDKDTKKEAVCQIFENVNTGGVPLTVFELVTAIFASDNYDLRDDWKKIKTDFAAHINVNLLKDMEPHYMLMAMSLLITYQKNLKDSSAVSCKKRDILRMSLEDYKDNRDALVAGFKEAANFLVHLGIYSTNNIPYETQLIPLAAIFAYDNTHSKQLNMPNAKEKLSKWYWCGVFGELYGGANETRFANDIVGVFRWLNDGEQPDTVVRANFNANRLLSLCTRNSAAYKGIMALIIKECPLDFMTGQQMNIASYLDESTDIHHIYPEKQCVDAHYPANRWNSVINKTLIYASTNRSIGGRRPSEYIGIMKNKGLLEEQIISILCSHKINPELLRKDDFYAYTKDRATQLLNLIEKAMGKAVDGRASAEIISEFGEKI